MEKKMGRYLNPNTMSKEEWLIKFAKPLHTTLSESPKDIFDRVQAEGRLPVVWVDNGALSAAALGWCPEELEAFLTPGDPRGKILFTVTEEQSKEFV